MKPECQPGECHLDYPSTLYGDRVCTVCGKKFPKPSKIYTEPYPGSEDSREGDDWRGSAL